MPTSAKRSLTIRVALLTIVVLATVVYCQNADKISPKMNNLLSTSNVTAAPTVPAVQTTLSKADYANGTKRAAEAAQRVAPRLAEELKGRGMEIGSPVFIRIFKESKELELWMEATSAGTYKLFKTYPIAAMSGVLGPKLAEGDKQAPEGFYFVGKSRMNPESRFHLAFNVGYPNAYDQAHGRDGSFIMVHGNQVSIGCYAMTDYYIEEIYTLCDAALNQGQPYFRVHSFPFRLTEENLATKKNHKWHSFWKNELKPGFDHFEASNRPPNVEVSNKRYHFGKV